jgi:hypothetical protein
MDKNQKQLIDTYFRKRKIASQQSDSYDICTYEMQHYLSNYFNYETDILTNNIIEGLLKFSDDNEKTEQYLLKRKGIHDSTFITHLYDYSNNKSRTEDNILKYMGDDITGHEFNILLNYSVNKDGTILNIFNILNNISGNFIKISMKYADDKLNIAKIIINKFIGTDVNDIDYNKLAYLYSILIENNSLQPDVAYKLIRKYGDSMEDYDLVSIIIGTNYLQQLAPAILNIYLNKYSRNEIIIDGLKKIINNTITKEEFVKIISNSIFRRRRITRINI